MKRIAMLFLLLLNAYILSAQVNTLNGFEYWFDSNFDGREQGTAVGEKNNIAQAVNTASLTEGLHTFSFRVKDSRGSWSVPYAHFFIRLPLGDAASLNQMEYWFDENKESRLSKAISGDRVTINETLDVSTLTDGLHTLTLRVKDAAGEWSIPSTHFFLKVDQNPATMLSTCEYWFDENTGSKVTKGISGATASINEALDVSTLTDGLHTLTLRVKDATGEWSKPSTHFFLKVDQNPDATLSTCEYWFDENTGSKMAKSISGATASINEALDVSSLTEGLHTLSLRVKDEKDRWSKPTTFFFIKVKSGPTPLLGSLEYWIDDRKTETVVKQLESNEKSSISEVVDVKAVPDGLHTISFRAKSSDGAWSGTTSRFFLKQTLLTANNKINGYRYWTDSLDNSMVKEDVDPVNPLVLSNLKVPVKSKLTPTPEQYEFEPNPIQNQHIVRYHPKSIFNIQFRDVQGQWSWVKADTIRSNAAATVRCDTLLSKVPKTVQQPLKDTIHFYMVNALVGDSLAFKASVPLTIDIFDPYGKKLKTIISEQSTTGNGVHAALDGAYYALAHGFGRGYGSYTIEYTHISKYAILGYTPKKVGNKGTSLMVFEGNGFTQDTKIRLLQNGVEKLIPEKIFCKGLSSLTASFNFDNVPIGSYDIEVNYGDNVILINNGLEVEEAKPIELDVSVMGPSAFRSGTPTTYTITVENKGNSTAYSVPVGISIKYYSNNAISSIIINNNDDKYNKIPNIDYSKYSKAVADSIKNYFNKLNDKSRFLQIYNSNDGSYCSRNELFISSIPPLSKFTLTITISSSSNVEIKASVPKRLKSVILKKTQSVKITKSIQGCCIKEGIECIVNLIFMYPQIKKIMESLPIDKSCVISSMVNYISLAAGIYCDGTDSDNFDINTGFDYIGAVSSSLLKCIDSKDFNILSKILKGLDFVADVQSIWKCGVVMTNLISGKCNDDYNEGSLNSNSLRSCDPNDKIGYRSPSGSRYFNANKKNFTYIINFENKASATAPAQEVVVTDTLDSKIFELESFRAGYIKIGSKIADASFDAMSSTWNVDMRPNMNLRTNVKLEYNSKKGIARWHFTTIDPMTGEKTADPLAGFLPPNDTLGNGQGSVSFSINLKDNIDEGASVRNRASIVFDNNEAILTPSWNNIKDVTAPESSMLAPTVLSDNMAVLSWKGKDNEGGSGLYRYNLFVKRGDEPMSALLANTPNTNLDFEYKKGIKYQFFVNAIDSAGNVEDRRVLPDAEFFIPNDIIAPISTMSQPTIISKTQATLNWQGKDEDGGSGIKCYTLYMKKDGEEYVPILAYTSLTTTTFTYEKGVHYQFYVKAEDNAGNIEVKNTIPEVDLFIPKDVIAPTSWMLKPEKISENELLLKWDGKDNEGGSGLRSFDVFVKKGNADYIPLLSNSNLRQTTYSYEKEVEYKFYVVAIDDEGNIERKNNHDTEFYDTDENSNNEKIVIYPNPSSEGALPIVEFRISDEQIKKSEMLIYSLQGSLIKTEAVTQRQIQLKNISRGVYIVNLLINKKQKYFKKMIIM